MAVYVVRQLSPKQRALVGTVCARARTLHDRLRELSQRAWHGAEPADVAAVRAWLFDVHRGDAPTAAVRYAWASIVDSAE